MAIPAMAAPAMGTTGAATTTTVGMAITVTAITVTAMVPAMGRRGIMRIRETRIRGRKAIISRIC